MFMVGVPLTDARASSLAVPGLLPPRLVPGPAEPGAHPELLLDRLARMEATAVRLVELDEFAGAVALLSSAIALCPLYASAYYNRAFVHWIRGSGWRAVADLNNCILLAATLHADARLLTTAYTQRAIIHKSLGLDEQAWEDLQEGVRLARSVARSAAAASRVE